MSATGGRRGRPPYPDLLTPAEEAVLKHLREGLTNAEIAVRLGIPPDGVKYHVSNMLAKLDLPDRYALARWQPAGATRRRPWVARRVLSAIVGLTAFGAVGAGILFAVAGGGASTRPGALPDVKPTLAVDTYVLTEATFTAADAFPLPRGSGAGGPGEQRQTRRVYYQAPDRQRTETTNAGSDMPINQLIDGSNIFTWLGSSPNVIETPNPLSIKDLATVNGGGLAANGTTLSERVAAFARGGTVHLSGDSVVAGRAVYVIDVGAPPCRTGIAIYGGPSRYWIDKQTLFVLKTEHYSPTDSHVEESITVTSVQYNATIDPNIFSLPSNARVSMHDPAGGCNARSATPSPPRTVTGTTIPGSGIHVVQESCGSSRETINTNPAACPTPLVTTTPAAAEPSP